MVDRYGPVDCEACRGGECRGGGNRHCIRRDPRPSVLAGILDTYGCIRFVVDHRSNIHHHVRHDETCVVVKGLRVHEPIAWGDIPHVIDRIHLSVERWIRRGIPNEPSARQAATMYRLRQLENPVNKKTLDLAVICET